MSTQAPLMVTISGMRGIAGESLTRDRVVAYLGAFSLLLNERTGTPRIVIGRDGRQGGEQIHQHAIDALTATGCDVIDLDTAMTPTVGLMVRRLGADGGAVITASHNPAQWNGVKCIDHTGAALPPDRAALLVELYESASVPPSERTGAVERRDDAARLHVQTVLDAVAEVVPLERIRERAFSVALDSVNASGSLAGPMLLEALGCEVDRVACEGDGVFPHTPEPTEANLQSLCARLSGAGADIGFAQDPDADRLAIVDDRAAYIGEEHTLVLAARALLGAESAPSRPRVAANLSTSRMIDDFLSEIGGEAVRTAVGEANVVAGMRARQCVLGGEGNGGVIWPRIVEIRDSLGAMALVLALLTRRGDPLSSVVASYPGYAIVKRKVDTREGFATSAVGAIRDRFGHERIDTSDGVRVDFDDQRAWLHVRPSNTEPILRLIAEAPDRAIADAILDEAQSIIEAL